VTSVPPKANYDDITRFSSPIPHSPFGPTVTLAALRVFTVAVLASRVSSSSLRGALGGPRGGLLKVQRARFRRDRDPSAETALSLPVFSRILSLECSYLGHTKGPRASQHCDTADLAERKNNLNGERGNIKKNFPPGDGLSICGKVQFALLNSRYSRLVVKEDKKSPAR